MKVPPVIQFLLSAMAAWGLSRFFAVFSISLPMFFELLTGLVGVVFLVFALLQFRARKTTINPTAPSKASALVTDGVFRVTRNPMYVGLLFLLIAWCLWLGDLAALAAVPVFIFTITTLQILPEERVLAQLFGETYRQYQKRVSRWLLF